jgi:hypothetical protein
MGGKVSIGKLFLNIISLDNERYRFFTFLIILILLSVLPFSLIEKTHNLSICSRILGKYCFSVGITRGVSSLLRGNIGEAMEYNFLSIIVLAVIIGFLVHDFYIVFIKSRR